VAAPTAGLHFTPELLASLEAAGIRRATVTLHVGPGTFAPLRDDVVDGLELHAERYVLPDETARAIAEQRAAGRPVIAVGTTVARTLESCAEGERLVRAGGGETRLFIKPGFRFRVVDALVTNFHLPRSSLLMLVAALAGKERILAAYAEAVARGYRFYSYGDAMLIK
jgi:S-adenosylmethionine:tRNA ribosyltransferase-isomerase